MHQLMSIKTKTNLEFEIRVKWKCEWGLVETLEMGNGKVNAPQVIVWRRFMSSQ